MTLNVSVAVQDMIETHDRYDAESLAEMIATKYSNNPTNVIPYIVVSATTAARHVANIHMLRELYRDALDPEHRRRAEHATTSMLSWSFGLRRMEVQHIPSPPPITVENTLSVAESCLQIPEYQSWDILGKQSREADDLAEIEQLIQPSSSGDVTTQPALDLANLVLPVDEHVSAASLKEMLSQMAKT